MDLTVASALACLLLAGGGYMAHKSWSTHFSTKTVVPPAGNLSLSDAVWDRMYDKYIEWWPNRERPTVTAFRGVVCALWLELSKHREFHHHFVCQDDGLVFKNTRTLSLFYFEALPVKLSLARWLLSLSDIEKDICMWFLRDVVNRVPQHATALQGYGEYLETCQQWVCLLATSDGFYIIDGKSNLLYVDKSGRLLNTKGRDGKGGPLWVDVLLSPCSEWQRQKWVPRLSKVVESALAEFVEGGR